VRGADGAVWGVVRDAHRAFCSENVMQLAFHHAVNVSGLLDE
jgi:hypothetical protein